MYGDHEQSLTRKIIHLAVSKWKYKKASHIIYYEILWPHLPSKLNKEILLYIGMNEEKKESCQNILSILLLVWQIKIFLCFSQPCIRHCRPGSTLSSLLTTPMPSPHRLSILLLNFLLVVFKNSNNNNVQRTKMTDKVTNLDIKRGTYRCPH